MNYRIYFFLLIIGTYISCLNARPLVTIITSVYNGDFFIEGFLKDITQQTIFDRCELILINANSPGNEEEIIKKYLLNYQNIRYTRLKKDPGIYGVWNTAIKMAQADYVTNANIDDRLKYDCYEKHLQCLDENPHIDLVYSDVYVSGLPNETFEENNHKNSIYFPAFSIDNMRISLPNNHPMWRKSMHDRCGFFNPNLKSVGDWEMWLRAVKAGSKFLKCEEVYGLYYRNPNSLSLSRDKKKERIGEFKCVFEDYKDFLGLTDYSFDEFMKLFCQLISDIKVSFRRKV